MYLEFYGLKEKPFQITCDPKFLWLSETHKEALAMLRYGILDNRGFLLLTGEVGTGKTLLINHLFTKLSEDMIAVTISDPDLNRDDIYKLLADGFNLSTSFNGKAEFLIQLRNFLHKCAADNKLVVLIVDEAHRLNHHLMEDLRTLSNIELPHRKLINIFLVGQHELNQVLGREENRAFSQRITLRHQIEPLDRDETCLYVQNRLEVAGSSKKIFKDAAVNEIFKYSAGIPRLINILCDHALLTGCVSGVKQIDDRIIVECAQELRIPTQHKSVPTFRYTSEPSETKSDLPDTSHPVENKDTKPASQEEIFDVGGFVHPVGSSRYQRWVMVGIVPFIAIVLVLAWIHLKDKIVLHGNTLGVTDSQHRVIAEAKELPSEAVKATTDSRPSLEDGNTLRAGDSADEVARGPMREQSNADAIGEEDMDKMTVGWPESRNVPVEFDQANGIVISSLVAMDQVADDLITFPERMVYIHGYVKGAGNARQRQMTWHQRIDAMKAYLVNKGVSFHQIKPAAMDSRSMDVRVEGNAHLYAVIELPSDEYSMHYNPDK